MLRSFPALVILATAAITAASPVAADEIVLKDGSRIQGEIVKLVGGKLTVKTTFAGTVTVSWAEIVELETDKPLPFTLEKGTTLVGTATTMEDGALAINTEASPDPIRIGLADVTAINPPPAKPPVTYRGLLSLGGSVNDGNTRTKSLSTNGEFEARSKRQRFTMSAAYNYAEDDDGLRARNARLSSKYDFFPTDRFYLFTSVLFEGDEFQDLNLRSAISAGPGYQFIDTDDFSSDYFREMQLSAEAGIAYFNEDFETAEDEDYVSARWSVKFDWAVLPDRLALFHVHEGFPGLEDIKDLYIRSEQGVRITLIENLFATFQVNWRWDNTPAANTRRSDTTYIASIGYKFTF